MPTAVIIDLWDSELDQRARLNDAWAVMSEPERQRATHFRRDQERVRFCCSRLFLRTVLARYRSQPAASLRFATNPHGKPQLAPMPNTPELHFNLSHSEDRALLAVTRAAPVGVDLEIRRAVANRDEIAAVLFSDGEARALMRCAAASRDTMFLRGWTRKEAMLKALGIGFADAGLAPRTVLPTLPTLPLEAGGPWRVACGEPARDAVQPAQLFDLSNAAYLAAVAILCATTATLRRMTLTHRHGGDLNVESQSNM